MKSCPKCSRVYADDALNFCLDDGEWLVGSDASEPATAILSGVPPSEANTRAQVTTTYPNSDPSTISGSPAANATSYGKLALIIGSIALLAILAIGAYKYVGSTPKAAPLSFEKAKLTRLTTTGKATKVAISPDGKYVVHVQDDGGQQSLWTRQTATQSNVQIVAPSSVRFDSLTFSRDGDYIYYSVSSQDMPQGVLFQVPTLGGAPKKLLVDFETNGGISFSPDGKEFAFVRSEMGKEFALTIANADGTGERKLAVHENPHESIGRPAWSPDGKLIAYVVLNRDSNDFTVFGAQVADGSTKPLTSQRWFRITGLTWLSDGSGLLMLATPGQQFIRQIWQLSYPAGEARQLTNDLDDYDGMSLTADSGTLAVVKSNRPSNVWVAPVGDESRARAVTSGTGTIGVEVAFSPNGRTIIYSSYASGDEDIWMVNADGGSQRQLTANARANGYPSISPDGRHIVFMSDRSGVPHLWLMNIDGSDQRQLTNGIGELSPQFSPDGRWVVYKLAFGKRTLWKVPADGGEPMQLNDSYSSSPTVSPDGKLFAYHYRDENTPWRIAVEPFEGGEPLKTFDLPDTFSQVLHWTPDSRGLAYVETKNGVSNIVAQPLDGGAVRQLTNFTSDRIFWFDISRDGKQIAVSRGTQSSDVVLIKDF